MRGDRPSACFISGFDRSATPHARGSTLVRLCIAQDYRGYPACAGIDLVETPSSPSIRRLPRMRGDRPLRCIGVLAHIEATPHARGSTRWPDARARRLHGYPACAGIDPRLAHTRTFRGRLPRMRGDRPFIAELQALAAEATPHARGSTLS
mgnify:CR=1 FL=1